MHLFLNTMAKKKKKTEKAIAAEVKANRNFIMKISSQEDDMKMMEPFIERDDIETMKWVAANVYALRKKATNEEIIVAKHLWMERVKFIPQAPFLIHTFERDRIFFADFYIPAISLLIEIDGSQHRKPEGLLSDMERDRAFDSIGIKTIRIPNQQVKSGRYKEMIPIPPEEFLRPLKIVYLKEGESGITRERKEEKVKNLLGYGTKKQKPRGY